MKLAFEWDEAKARENLRKHKVGFDEGKTIFTDPFLLTFPDIDTSSVMQRSVMIHTDRQGRIRIIAAVNIGCQRKHYEEG